MNSLVFHPDVCEQLQENYTKSVLHEHEQKIAEEKFKVEIYNKNKCQRTALLNQILDKKGNKEKLKILLNNGADINAQDIHGNTVLHLAAWVGCDIETIDLLKGALPTRDKQGLLPCQVAQKRGHALLAKQLCVCNTCCDRAEVSFISECVHFQEQYPYEVQDVKCFQKRVKYFKPDALVELLDIPGVGKVKFDGEADEIKTAITEIVKNICRYIGGKNDILANVVLPSGSVIEGTKVGLPDEFDFICLLCNLSKYCQVDESYKIDEHNFVLTKVKSEYCTEEFKHIYYEKQPLKVKEVHDMFTALLKEALAYLGSYLHTNLTLVNIIYTLPNCILTFQWNGCEYKDLQIDVDLVPALQIPGWWPSQTNLESLPFDTETLRQEGALLTFNMSPDRSDFEGNVEHLLRVSAMTAENAFFDHLPTVLRDAYIVSKIMRDKRICPSLKGLTDFCDYITHQSISDNLIKSYHLKLCLFQLFIKDSKKGECSLKSLHKYVCNIFEIFQTNIGKSLYSILFPWHDVLYTPLGIETYANEEYLQNSIGVRQFYSALIVHLLRRPEDWKKNLETLGINAWCSRFSGPGITI